MNHGRCKRRFESTIFVAIGAQLQTCWQWRWKCCEIESNRGSKNRFFVGLVFIFEILQRKFTDATSGAVFENDNGFWCELVTIASKNI